MKKEWSEFKQILEKYSLSFNFLETTNFYEVFTYLGEEKISCLFPKPSGDIANRDEYAATCADFETNYKDLAEAHILKAVGGIADGGDFSFKGERIFSAENVTTEESVYYYDVIEERFINGVVIKGKNTNFLDKVRLDIVLQIMPEDPETVIKTFAPSWAISDDLQQIELYKAKLPAGLRVKLTYYKTGPLTPSFWVNGFLHKKG